MGGRSGEMLTSCDAAHVHFTHARTMRRVYVSDDPARGGQASTRGLNNKSGISRTFRFQRICRGCANNP